MRNGAIYEYTGRCDSHVTLSYRAKDDRPMIVGSSLDEDAEEQVDA